MKYKSILVCYKVYFLDSLGCQLGEGTGDCIMAVPHFDLNSSMIGPLRKRVAEYVLDDYWKNAILPRRGVTQASIAFTNLISLVE